MRESVSVNSVLSLHYFFTTIVRRRGDAKPRIVSDAGPVGFQKIHIHHFTTFVVKYKHRIGGGPLPAQEQTRRAVMASEYQAVQNSRKYGNPFNSEPQTFLHNDTDTDVLIHSNTIMHGFSTRKGRAVIGSNA